MEGCRAVAHTIAMANGLKVRDPRRFMPLITDTPVETVMISKDEFNAIAARYKFSKNGNRGGTEDKVRSNS